MSGRSDERRSVTIVASETVADCYDWVIHAPDRRYVVRSPYAFSTRTAARLSGECWRREMESSSSDA